MSQHSHTALHAGVFDLSAAEGVTDSERVLMRLCKKSFLSLWAHANLHTAQDIRGGKGSAKEFADVLVVFGSDVILFSDKHITFQEDKDISIAWPRWFKRAVSESAKQLHGAMSWLRRFPERIFLDATCTRPLPVLLPGADQARYHLVAVTRGSRNACLKMFPDSFGTLQINTDIEGSDHEKNPFSIGILDRTKHFVHVLDEFSLEVVMDEMDTITDFVAYLRAREDFLSNTNMSVIAAGEEQLIAAYISNGDTPVHPFLPVLAPTEKGGLIIFDSSHYGSLLQRPEYQAKRQQDEQSRIWDDLVERLIRLGNPKLLHPSVEQPNHETEKALRLMAAESRLRRSLLTDSLLEMLGAAAERPGERRARIFTTLEQPDLVYIFLVTPKYEDETDDDYRRHRVGLLHAYCRCAKLRFPEASTFIALGFDHPVKNYEMFSEDLIVFTCEKYTPQEKAEAENFQKTLGILADGFTVRSGYATEFPCANTSKPSHHVPNRPNGKKKAKRKLAKASRRRNRK